MQATGDPNLPAFKAALQTVRNEYARILNSATLSGIVSDQARKELEEFTSENSTFEQMVNVIALLKQDALNRKTSYAQQISEVKNRISPNFNPASAPSQPQQKAAPANNDPLGIRR